MAVLKALNIYRSDFKINADGDSFFDTVILSTLDVPDEKQSLISEIEVYVQTDDFLALDKEGELVNLKEGK